MPENKRDKILKKIAKTLDFLKKIVDYISTKLRKALKKPFEVNKVKQ